jgi:hypothetical protein
MLYSCRYSGGYFVDLAPDCAGNGHEVLGEAGAVYTQPPADVPTVAVYRCVVLATGDHFVSRDSACESTADKIRNEGRLGYVRNMAPLLRFALPGGGEWTSAWGYSLPAGGQPATGLGYLSLVKTTGTVTLNMCQAGGDQFLSLSTDCDGGTLLRSAGEIWSSPPSGVAGTAPLLACRGPGGDRFESLDQFCEGGSQPSTLGYVVTRF